MATALRESIREYKFHVIGGDYPEVPTYSHVDTGLLYEGDKDPFHVVLPIARVGETSANGLVYDQELVSAIEQQLPGQSGIRGHQSDDDLQYKFPTASVYWIGHTRVGETLWAKGYIPPGENREDIRRRKAAGGALGTSIFGDAVRETANTKRRTWRAKNFQLTSLDLGAGSQVSLKLGGKFAIVGEFEEGREMPVNDNEIRVEDVPQSVRETIIRQAQLEQNAGRVSELNTRVSELETQVAEMRQFASIVAEIRTYAGADTDIAAQFREMYTTINRLRETLGPEVNIELRVNEMHTQVQEFALKEFERGVDGQIAELTPWAGRAITDDQKKKVAAFQKNMKRGILAELGAERGAERVAETAKKLWDEEFQLMAEPLVRELAGPNAVIPGRDPRKHSDGPTDEELRAEGERFVNRRK